MEFQTMDLGRILQTAESIKSMRNDSITQRLQQQYLGTRQKAAEQEITMNDQAMANNTRNQQIVLGKEKAQQVAVKTGQILQAADIKGYIEQAEPELVKQWAEQGVDWQAVTPEQTKQMVTAMHNHANQELGVMPAERPVQMETMEGPGGSLLQRDPTTGALKSVLGREQKPAQTSVSVNTGQETEEAKSIGRALGEQYAKIQESGVSANTKIGRYERMGQLFEGVRTGKLTPKLTEVAAIADSLGIKLDPKIGEKQAVQALSNEIALQLRNPSGGAGMPGAMSDKDREFLVSMTPSLANTPEGNKLIIQSAVKLAKRDQDVAKMAREYRTKNKTLEGFSDELAKWSDDHPLFGTESAIAGAAGAVDFTYKPGQGLQKSR